MMVGGGFFPNSLVEVDGRPGLNPFGQVSGSEGNFLSKDQILIVEPVDISKPLRADNGDFQFRRIPSEQAWANAVDPIYGVSSGLPVNSIDIVLVIDRAKNPDGVSEATRNSQATPAQPPIPNQDPFSDASIDVGNAIA